MGRGEYKDVCCLITVILLIAGSAIFLLTVRETMQCY